MDDAIKKMLDRLDVLIGKGHVKRFPKVCADTVRRDEIRQIAKDLRSKLTEGTGGKEEKRFFRVATAEGVSNFSDIKQANDAYAGFLQALLGRKPSKTRGVTGMTYITQTIVFLLFLAMSLSGVVASSNPTACKEKP